MALFGTDGIRGLANRDLTAELALDVAVAAAHILVETNPDKSHRPKAIVGQDSRASGEFLEAAVVAGLTSAGVDVYRVGVLPTPAIAHLVAESGADLGVMISASHNPMPDNGIKLFSRGGGKLDDAIEAAIEARIGEPWERPTGSGVGRAINDESARERYISHLLSSVSTPLKGLKIVVDCANGASSTVAPDTYRRAGAEVISIFDAPDGWNINDDCGSTHLHQLRTAVLREGADFGIAHDGDADRALAIDAQGNEVVITAEVAAALIVLENPAELISAIFEDPGQVLLAISNIGADMSEEERTESEKIIVASVIAGQAAVTAAGMAAQSTTTRTPSGGGSTGGGGAASGRESKGVRRRKP